LVSDAESFASFLVIRLASIRLMSSVEKASIYMLGDVYPSEYSHVDGNSSPFV
jgi:hypothetical protein